MNFDDIFKVDSENPFSDSEFEENFSIPNVLKILFSKENSRSMDNYGIYDYFKNSEHNYSKLIAAVYDDKFVFNPQYNVSTTHTEMVYNIQDYYGNFDCFLASVGDDLIAYCGNYISSDKCFILENCFRELKDYYVESGKNISIMLTGSAFGDKFNGCRDCSSIDVVIDGLASLREEKNANIFNYDWNNDDNYDGKTI